MGGFSGKDTGNGEVTRDLTEMQTTGVLVPYAKHTIACAVLVVFLLEGVAQAVGINLK